MSKIVLGKGLGALIPAERYSEKTSGKYLVLSLDKLAPNPMQPRRRFDDASLRELAESFKLNGIIQPLVVRRDGNGYTIVAGERRFRAARLCGLAEVPVVVMDNVDDPRMLELALIENIQREDLNPLEAAQAFRRLIDDCGLTQNQMAARVGRSRAAVANLLRLLSLPETIKGMIRTGQLTEGHARAILALDNPSDMMKLAQRIVNESLSVRATETVARKPRRRLIPRRKAPMIAEIETNLKQWLGTSVKICTGLKKGRIEIEYYGDDDLSRIYELLRPVRH